MIHKSLILLFLVCPMFMFSQGVGINTTNPQATLDVRGTVNVEENLFLENPGAFQFERGANLLIQKTDISLVKYNIVNSKYGPINYVEYLFRNTSSDVGVQDYNTMIDAEKYFVSVQGFRYFPTGGGIVLLKSQSGNNKWMEGYQMYAYKKKAPLSTVETWWIKGIVNNTYFHKAQGSTNPRSNVDLTMNVIIYRNEFITKGHDPIKLDMAGKKTATAPLPIRFQ